MSGSITLHPERGVNPRMTYCPRCGKDANELVLLGARERKVTCPGCGCVNFGAGTGGDCGNCGRPLWNGEVGTIGEHERLPATEPCNECRKELDLHAAVVAEGGVYWKCRDCKKSGVIYGSSGLAQAVRKTMGIEPPAPCGVEFSKAEGCPACGKES